MDRGRANRQEGGRPAGRQNRGRKHTRAEVGGAAGGENRQGEPRQRANRIVPLRSPSGRHRRPDHHLERLCRTRESPSDLSRKDAEGDCAPALVLELNPDEVPTSDRRWRDRGSEPPLGHRAPCALSQSRQHRRNPLRPDAGKLEGDHGSRFRRSRSQERQRGGSRGRRSVDSGNPGSGPTAHRVAAPARAGEAQPGGARRPKPCS